MNDILKKIFIGVAVPIGVKYVSTLLDSLKIEIILYAIPIIVLLLLCLKLFEKTNYIKTKKWYNVIHNKKWYLVIGKYSFLLVGSSIVMLFLLLIDKVSIKEYIKNIADTDGNFWLFEWWWQVFISIIIIGICYILQKFKIVSKNVFNNLKINECDSVENKKCKKSLKLSNIENLFKMDISNIENLINEKIKIRDIPEEYEDKKLTDEDKKMIREAIKIIIAIEEMEKKYDENWFSDLFALNGCSLLSEYYEKVRAIENFATQIKSESTDKGHSYNINMNHLLYHIMNQHFISFSGVEDNLNKPFIEINQDDSSKNLSRSFMLSEQISNFLVTGNFISYNPDDDNVDENFIKNLSKKLKNKKWTSNSIKGKSDKSDNYAWFSNMKFPDTFANTESVKVYYAKLSEIFSKNENVNVRRIHLFYEDLITNIEFAAPLFAVLLVEKLMRIESKVVYIKNFDKYKESFFHFDWANNFEKIRDCSVFLLDFALFHDHSYGNYISLFSDFCFEKLEDKNMDIIERVKRYKGEQVYCLTEYNIFHFLKSYYLSFWNKDKYVLYLKNLENAITDEKAKIKSKKRITNIRNFYEENISVMDLFDFWKEFETKNNEDGKNKENIDNISNFFNGINKETNPTYIKFSNAFTSLYCWPKYVEKYNLNSNIINKQNIIDDIISLLTKFNNDIKNDSTSIYTKPKYDENFLKIFNAYFLR